MKKYCETEKGKETRRAVQRRYNQRLKRACIEAYGGKCVCCGETEIAFLTIDHEFNDGVRHRRTMFEKLGVKPAFGTYGYQMLKQLGWPQDQGLRVMCFNCNCGRQVNGGVCPHQVKGAAGNDGISDGDA